jgi:hypothetical protein
MVVAVTLEIYEDSKFGVPEVKGRNESGSLRIPAAAPSSYDYGHLNSGSPTAESEIGGRQSKRRPPWEDLREGRSSLPRPREVVYTVGTSCLADLNSGSPTAESEIGGRQRYMTSVVHNQTVS